MSGSLSQEALLLAVLAALGFYAVRWTLRLAPPLSELPLKTLLAALLCAFTAGLGLAGVPVTRLLYALALLLGPLYILAPFALTALARGRFYRAAEVLADLLYWSPLGRAGMKRLLAQVALRHEDAEVALSLLPAGGGDVLRLQAYALQGRWDELLALSAPERGDNAFLGQAARVEAHLERGDEAAAEAEVAAMEERWRAQGEGPLGYRSVTLSRARLYAYRGDLAETQRTLQVPLPGVPPHRVFEILARAAEGARSPQAGALYAQAYRYAPPNRRAALEAALARHAQPLPEAPAPARRAATLSLTAFLVALYVLQLWAGERYGPNAWALAAGFLTAPGLPAADALWRGLSYAFVHGGLLHIGLNAWVLLDIGRLYETRRPWGSLLAAFVFGAAMGAYLTFVAQGGAPPGVIGASGGVLGVGGALLADALRGSSEQDKLLRRSLLQWIAFIVLFSVALPGVSLWGHVGGLVGGLLWGFMRQGLPRTRQLDLAAGVLSLLLLGYALVSALGWLWRYGPQP